MKTRNIVTAAIALIAGAYTISRFGTDTFGILSGVNVAVLITIAGVVIGAVLDRKEEVKQGFVVEDERSTQQRHKSGYIAFQIGNYLWLALLWYEFLSRNWLPTPTIGSPGIVIIGMLAQVGVFLVAMYQNRK